MSCSNCEGVVVMDGQPMTCGKCGSDIRQTSDDAAPGGAR